MIGVRAMADAPIQYPLKSLWDDALNAVSALVTEAERLDQEWCATAFSNLPIIETDLMEALFFWILSAKRDGRTS